MLRISSTLLFTRDVEEEGVAVAGCRLVLAGVLAAHQGPAGGREESGLAVDGLQVVLGADEGMVASESFHLGLDVPAISRYVGGDLVGVVGEHGADVVCDRVFVAGTDGARLDETRTMGSYGIARAAH
jgi:hypothetical protein